MLLDDYLSETGKTKAGLAKELGVSKPAISKWEEIPEKWMVVLFPNENKKPGTQYSLEEIEALCKMRTSMKDEGVAKSVGLTYHELQGMIQRLKDYGYKKGLKQVEEMKLNGTWPPPCIADGNLPDLSEFSGRRPV